MRRSALVLALGLVALGACVAVAAASPADLAPARAAASRAPKITSVKPTRVTRRHRMTILGRNFVAGRRANTVVFLGARTRKDDVRVRVTRRTSRKLVFTAPAARIRRNGPGAVSGRIQVVNRRGRSKVSRVIVRFDDDGDGLSNEDEIRKGTNPRNPDTDGDGIPDGRDPDPLHPPVKPPPPPPPPPSGGVTSTVDGLQGVSDESRPLVAHTAYGGGGFQSYRLMRKPKDAPDSSFAAVASTTNPAAGKLRDGERVAVNPGRDHVYRTDVVTGSGVIPGVNAVPGRGGATVFDGGGSAFAWGALNVTCASCGQASVSGGNLHTQASGDGQGGSQDTVGSVAIYQERLGLDAGDEVYTRATLPARPTASSSYAGSRLALSADHPSGISGSGAIADVAASSGPWVAVELRALSNGAVKVVVLDSAAPAASGHVVAETTALRDDPLGGGAILNSFLVVRLLGGGAYRVEIKSNLQAANNVVDLDPGAGTDRALPAGLTSPWLSLGTQVSRGQTGLEESAFDEAVVKNGSVFKYIEDFGDIVGIVTQPNFQAQSVAAGLLGPTAVDFAADGKMFIALKDGYVKVRKPDGTLVDALDIENLVNSRVGTQPLDQGLTGLVLDPSFGTNGYVYLYYTVATAPDDAAVRTVSRVVRYTYASATDTLGSPLVLVGGDNAAAAPVDATGGACPPGAASDCLPSDRYTHSSGALRFGSDGKLWISTPDGAAPDGAGTGAQQTDILSLRAQNDNSLAGKVLRVDPATGDGAADNPGYSALTPKSPASRIWAKGFRNPFRLAQRPGGGPWFLGDVGWGAWEEVNKVPSSGLNYGWPCYEGGPDGGGGFTSLNNGAYRTVFPSDCPAAGGQPNLTPPFYSYDSAGVDHAVIGAAFYTGTGYPAPWKPAAGKAAFYFTDYPSGDLTLLTVGATNALEAPPAGSPCRVGQTSDGKGCIFASGFSAPVMVTEGPADLTAPGGDRALYVVDLGSQVNPNGQVWRLAYVPPGP